MRTIKYICPKCDREHSFHKHPEHPQKCVDCGCTLRPKEIDLARIAENILIAGGRHV